MAHLVTLAPMGSDRVDNETVSAHGFDLVADVTSADLGAIEPVLRRLVDGEVTPIAGGFHVVAMLSGESARDLNRSHCCLPSAGSSGGPACGRHGRRVQSPSVSSTTFRRARGPPPCSLASAPVGAAEAPCADRDCVSQRAAGGPSGVTTHGHDRMVDPSNTRATLDR